MIIPLLSTHYSIGESIINLDNTNEIKSNSPVSAIAIALKYDLKELYNIETNFSGFIEGVENCKKNKITYRFGLKLCVCDDLNTKNEESCNNESNIVIWILNDQGYKDCLKIYNEAATKGFYYYPRTDWNSLNEKVTENLAFSFPFYSSFLAKNKVFNYRANIVPNLSKLTNRNFLVESHELPFDDLLATTVKSFSEANNIVVQESHTCYYYKDADFQKHMVFRCINKRTNFDKPNLNHYSSDKFSFEDYLNKINKKIL